MQNRLTGKGAEKKEYCALYLYNETAKKTVITPEHRQQIRKVCGICSPDIVIIGTPGEYEAAKLVSEKKDELKRSLPLWMLEKLEAVTREDYEEGFVFPGYKEAAISSELPAMVFPVGKKGLFAALWDMGEALFCGIDADLLDIPMSQIVIEVCECLSLDPYKLASFGTYIMVCRNGKTAERLLAEQGIRASCIGNITDGADRILRNGENIRYLVPAKQ
ncbi:MAG: hypothetical protein J5842_06520 [Lachnospiraceae bacterium]|nr:hypothetical protein [Lachnospiraceae bacterium]